MKSRRRSNFTSLMLLPLLALLTATETHAQTIQGTQNGGGLLERQYGTPSPTVSGPPLLSGFYFGFQKGNGSATDHHIAAIRVFPGGPSTDVSPNAQAPHLVIPRNRIELMYEDKNPDDRFFYNISHTSSAFVGAQRFQIRDVGCKGSCVRTLPVPPGGNASRVFVLTGFYVYFTGNRDRHVDRIEVFEENGVLTVTLRDKDVENDDIFGYMIDYVWLDSGTTRITEREAGGIYRDGGGAEFALSATNSPRVISGFSFDYLSKDHHLRDIGVRFEPERLVAFYGDKNGDDDVRWRVKWAEIGGQVVFPELRRDFETQ